MLSRLLPCIGVMGRVTMPELPTFQSVTIENFRGFSAAQTVDLDSSAVIVSGPNGTGKTSFFDAIQWLLIGSLPRFAALVSRRSDDYIVNRFGQGRPAVVAADLLLRGEPVRLVRTGSGKSTLLEWHGGDGVFRGEEADLRLTSALLSHGGVTLRDALMTSGILQQDVVRLVLQDEPKKRYRHMATLLGLADLAEFEEVVKSRADSLSRLASEARDQHATSEGQRRSADAELERLQERLGIQPELAALRSELAERVRVHAPELILDTIPSDLTRAAALGQEARQLRNRLDELLLADEDLRAREALATTVDLAALATLVADARAATELLERSQAEANDARSRHVAADERSGQLVALAARALPLLGPRCPVCEQAIDQNHVAEHLRRVIERGGEDLEELDQLADQAEQAVERHAAAVSTLDGEVARMVAAHQYATETIERRAAWLSECAELATSASSIANGTADGARSGEVAALQALRFSAQYVAGVADELVAVLGASTLAEQVERQRTVVDQRRAHAAASREAASVASQQAEDAKTMRNATTRATAAVTTTRFAQLQPLVNDIFGRLDPHPVFTTMRFELDVSYRSGVADPVVEDDEGVKGDPLLVFSSSQANVAALTYFLALSWSADAHALPFLLLDDPLQSMDDVNVLGFSDLCRHIRGRRQLIVSTHEQRLAGLLERKLAPRDRTGGLRVVRFVGWDRTGPKIDSETVEQDYQVTYLLDQQVLRP